MERESGGAEMKTISTAIIKDLGGILSEKCTIFFYFFFLAQSNSCSEKSHSCQSECVFVRSLPVFAYGAQGGR